MQEESLAGNNSHFTISFADPDPDPGSGAFLTPGSRIWDPELVFSGSRIPNPYFWELCDNFFGKKFYNSLKIGPNFFLQHFKNKMIYNFVKFVATKKVWQLIFFTPLFCSCFWIRDPGGVKIRIRDKHPGSVTLFTRGSNTRLKMMYYLFMAMTACTSGSYIQLHIHHPLANSHNTGGI